MSAPTPPEIEGLDYIKPLGSGGYSDVLLYEQQRPRMRVAVKVLKTDGLTALAKRQFIDEADTMAELADHPYIVQVFQSGTSADGRPYLVMKYYPPPNLSQRAKTSRFSVSEVLRTGIQLASAVETAHRAGVIHRDIKPANVLVSQYGTPALTDFGIAGRRATIDEDDDIGVSVPWAPPEVLFGRSNGDARADVYALAATLWQLLVGRSPFEVPGSLNNTNALMARIGSMPVPMTGRPDVPSSLERLLAQAMAKNPLARPATAMELARSLQQIEQDERLPRTAIVVLDEAGHTDVIERPPPPSTSSEASADSQPSGPPPPFSTPLPLPEPAAKTERVPPPAPGKARDRSSGSRSVGPRHAAGGRPGREERSLFATPASGSTPLPLPAPKSGPLRDRRVLAGGVAAGAVVALGAIAAIGSATGLFGGSDGPTTAPDGATLPGTPTLTVQSETRQLTFTFGYDSFEDGDQYRIRTSDDPSRMDSGTPSTIPAGQTSFAIAVDAGKQHCGQVQVVRGQDHTAWSEAKCEVAGS